MLRVPFEALLTSDQDAGVNAREALDGWLNSAVGPDVGHAVRLATSEAVGDRPREAGPRLVRGPRPVA
ncbi:MAG: hypothetical protein ACXVQ0_12440 [Actinomycetota bacterium]